VIARKRFARLFDGWETEIARPILVTLLTAFVVFLCSLALRPVRRFLFPIDAAYPLWCTAEAYATNSDSDLHLDIYVINRTDEDLNKDKLRERLEDRLPGSDASPDITAEFTSDRGRIANAVADSEFNRDKGSLAVKHTDRTLTIGVDQIQPYAILRATAVVSGLPEHPGTEVTRGMPSRVPVDMSGYQRACYAR
jgi:hypothetical protein